MKPHKCDFCGKSFKRPQDLKKHVKVGLLEAPVDHETKKLISHRHMLMILFYFVLPISKMVKILDIELRMAKVRKARN